MVVYYIYKDGKCIGKRYIMPKGSRRLTVLRHKFGAGTYTILSSKATGKRRLRIIVRGHTRRM